MRPGMIAVIAVIVIIAVVLAVGLGSSLLSNR